MKRMISTILTAALLSGCARYPALYMSPPAPEVANRTQIHKVIGKIEALGSDYRAGFQKTSKWSDFGQLPLIGVAAATALIAINKPTDAIETVAKIGIGTGVYSTTRSIFLPSNMPDLYRRGLSAVNCILSEAHLVAGPLVPSQVDKLTTAHAGLDEQITLLQSRAARTVKTKTDDEVKLVDMAKANARLQIAVATPILVAGGTELAAFAAAPGVFDRTANQISDAVATKSSVRTSVDVQALVASWTKPPAAQAVSTGVGGPSDPQEYADDLLTVGEELTRRSSAVSAAMPSRLYSALLADVAKCPAQI